MYHDNNSQYEQYLQRVRAYGTSKGDRTGTGTISTFGERMRFDLSKGFPLITTKKVHWRSIVYELLWLISGSTNVKFMRDNGVTIWDEWADEKGELGPIYGYQWRHWPSRAVYVNESGQRLFSSDYSIDQLTKAIETIRSNPDSRRIVVTAWNPADLAQMALEPCHMFFQFYVANGRLSCQMYQRSCDSFLGVPFNIASYSLLTHMVAQQCDLDVGDFVWVGGDCHIYNDHIEQVDLQLTRDVRPLPKLVIKRKPASIDEYCIDDFEIVDYNPHPHIPGKVSK